VDDRPTTDKSQKPEKSVASSRGFHLAAIGASLYQTLAKRADGKMGLTLVSVSEAKDAPNEKDCPDSER
jgi:hypothetical protein